PAAVIGQRDHRRSDRGVAALVDRGADLTHPKSEPRKECVEERRLPYARWAGEHRHAPAQYLSHTFETVTTLGAREVRRVSRALIRCESRACFRLANQVDLVDDDARRELVGLGNDEKAVEHARMRLRFGDGEDDYDLIDVGG